MKNHSQLEDLRRDPEKIFERTVRRKRRDPPGIETPLGHTYALILEALENEGLNANPDPQGFMRFVNGGLLYKFNRMDTPTYHTELCFAMEYACERGLSMEARRRILTEIVGPVLVVNSLYSP
ncbi:MAG: hypothetical protein HYW26_03825 [Candidatus Aenigmarchaeota archaeon]|nr:hypothetical protein [Candidatus Aenigmarchaeota archaeon]